MLVGFVLQTVLSSGYGVLVFIFFSRGLPRWAVWAEVAAIMFD